MPKERFLIAPLAMALTGNSLLARIKRRLTMQSMLLDFLEAMTILCFGLSWPISIRKSYVSRTAKGKSLFFELFLLLGYMFGIVRKTIQTVQGSDGFIFFMSFFFYVLNLILISIDVALYFRNMKLDKMRETVE